MKSVQHHGYPGGFWVRLFGVGISVSHRPLMFSERHGYTHVLRLPGGWKVKFLKRVRQP
jgi:hypothetical protein